MIVRPDRERYWRSWRRRWPRLVVVFAGAVMVTLLLVAIDWSPLEKFGLGWLLTIAAVLLWVLWLGLALAVSSLGVIAVALRVDRLVIDEGLVRRHLIFGRRMEVPVEGAALTRGRGRDVVTVPGSGRGRVLVPHLFYAPEELDRLWAAAGIEVAPPPEG